MKPVGLTNAHEPRVKPWAVVQLRQDNALGTLYNMVGFQTKLKHGEQARVFRAHPRAASAPNSPGSAACTATPSSIRRACSTPRLRLKAAPRLRFAGQITGCEGYVESAAIGLIAGRLAAAERLGRRARPRPRRRTAIGALLNHITGGHIEAIDAGPALVPADERQFRPVPADRGAAPRRGRASGSAGPSAASARKRALSARAEADLAAWLGAAR